MERHVRETAPREPEARAAWSAEFGDPKDSLASYPKQPDDEIAIRLAGLAKGLGIEMSRPRPAEANGPSTPSATNAEPFRSFAEYDDRVLAGPADSIEAPPSVVANFRETAGSRIREVVDLLADSDGPRWEMNESLRLPGSVPNGLGISRLHRIVLTEALLRARDRDEAGSERALRAAWNLNRSLLDRPEVISQFIAVSLARLEAGALRHLPVDPTSWTAILAQHDFRTSMLNALTVESYGRASSLDGTSAFERASRADFLDLTRRFLVSLRDSPVCDGTPEDLLAGTPDNRELLSAGYILGSISRPNDAHSWRRVDRLIVDIELTRKILQAREQRSRLGRWPEEIPGIEESRMSDGHWIYAVDSKGRLSIAFSRPLNWSDQHGLMLPQRYESD
jgi:hypothetical protein